MTTKTKKIIVLIFIVIVAIIAILNPLISIPLAFVAGFVTSQVWQRRKSTRSDKVKEEDFK